LIIAGPCSAETEDQVLGTAFEIKDVPGVEYFRAGIWKARSRPGEFTGAGDIALNWLKKVKDETGLKTCVEVARPVHIEKCLQSEVDIIWIGARTVVNPFAVEELSQALKGSAIPVMVKNPMHPDINLWIGAMERIHNAGVEHILAVHRGFSAFHREPFRNTPLWEIPIELKRQFPDLWIIVDPSHICGKRELIAEVSQLALDMAFDGLMIEVHPDPENALSDRQQQLTPAKFRILADSLKLRNRNPVVPDEEIGLLRKQIDSLDENLLRTLAERLQVAKKIGIIKEKDNISILQVERWKEVLQDRLEMADNMGLDKDFIRHLLELIHKESIRTQGR